MVKSKHNQILTLEEVTWVLNKLLDNKGMVFEAETTDMSDRFYEVTRTYRLKAKSTDEILEEESF